MGQVCAKELLRPLCSAFLSLASFLSSRSAHISTDTSPIFRAICVPVARSMQGLRPGRCRTMRECRWSIRSSSETGAITSATLMTGHPPSAWCVSAKQIQSTKGLHSSSMLRSIIAPITQSHSWRAVNFGPRRWPTKGEERTRRTVSLPVRTPRHPPRRERRGGRPHC